MNLPTSLNTWLDQCAIEDETARAKLDKLFTTMESKKAEARKEAEDRKLKTLKPWWMEAQQ